MHRLELEARRKAIVYLANKNISSIRIYHQVFALGGKDESVIEKVEEANMSANELYSHIKKEDSALKDWINNMSFKAFAMKPNSEMDLVKVDAFLGVGIQYILSWHNGQFTTEELKPFGLNKELKPVWLETWNSPWP